MENESIKMSYVAEILEQQIWSIFNGNWTASENPLFT